MAVKTKHNVGVSTTYVNSFSIGKAQYLTVETKIKNTKRVRSV